MQYFDLRAYEILTSVLQRFSPAFPVEKRDSTVQTINRSRFQQLRSYPDTVLLDTSEMKLIGDRCVSVLSKWTEEWLEKFRESSSKLSRRQTRNEIKIGGDRRSRFERLSRNDDTRLLTSISISFVVLFVVYGCTSEASTGVIEM